MDDLQLTDRMKNTYCLHEAVDIVQDRDAWTSNIEIILAYAFWGRWTEERYTMIHTASKNYSCISFTSNLALATNFKNGCQVIIFNCINKQLTDYSTI